MKTFLIKIKTATRHFESLVTAKDKRAAIHFALSLLNLEGEQFVITTKQVAA